MRYFLVWLYRVCSIVFSRRLALIVLCFLVYTPTASGQSLGALEEFLAPPPPPPPPPDPDPKCSLYSFEIDQVPDGTVLTEEDLMTWTDGTPNLSCLGNHVDEAISRCNAYWDSSWDAWDNCIARGYFMNETGYNDGTVADINSPGFEPVRMNCSGVWHEAGSFPENCKDNPREAVFYFDESCNSVVTDDANVLDQACDAGVLSWVASPISLLWEDGVDIEKDVRFTQFSLDPAKTGKWYEWKASAKAPLLVYDPQHSGQVSSATQLFGDWTFGGKNSAFAVSLSPSKPSPLPTKWENGYEALAQLDRNRDQKISGKELSELALWFDHNRDGVSQKGEVVSAFDAGLLTLFYKPDKHDKATQSITASIGFERLINGIVVKGASVDWYGEEGDTDLELSQKHMVRASLCRGEGAFRTEEASLLRREERTVEEIRSAIGAAYSGVWDWEATSASFAAAKKAKGILIFSTKGTRVLGHSMVELSLSNRTKAKSVMSLFPLTGALVSSGSGEILKFSVISGGRSAGRSEAILSADAKSLHGTTEVRMTYKGKLVNFSYSWRATRRGTKRSI